MYFRWTRSVTAGRKKPRSIPKPKLTAPEFLWRGCCIYRENVRDPSLPFRWPGNVQDRFSHWLEHDQHMAANTCRSYASAIRGAERYAQEHGFAFCPPLYGGCEEAGKTANTLFNDQGFIQLNYEQHRRFQAAIRKLLAFLRYPWEPESTRAIAGKDSPQASVPTVDVAPFIGILEEHFQKGYRLDSTLDRKRMRRYYENTLVE